VVLGLSVNLMASPGFNTIQLFAKVRRKSIGSIKRSAYDFGGRNDVRETCCL